jgi:hypothetical protein
MDRPAASQVLYPALLKYRNIIQEISTKHSTGMTGKHDRDRSSKLHDLLLSDTKSRVKESIY